MTTWSILRRSSFYIVIILVVIIGSTLFMPSNRIETEQEVVNIIFESVKKLEEVPEPENLVDFRTVQLIIETDKEEYELGEYIDTKIYIHNPTNENVSIRPIVTYDIDANSIYDPEPIAQGVFLSYPPRAFIEINANGKYTIQNQKYKPEYPGPFLIECLGKKKTVNVTGHKEVKLNSSGIFLLLEPSKQVLEDRDYVDFDLVILNDNPYPVKVPIFNPVSMGTEVDEMMPSMYLSWVDRYFMIEANSRWTLNLRGYQARYPRFSLYVSVDGVTVSLEMDVDQ